MTATEAAADCARVVIHARAHGTSTAGIQAGKRAPSDDLYPLTADAAATEDCAEDRRRTAPRAESDAHCPRQSAPHTVSPDSALDADLEMTAADPHLEGAPGLTAPPSMPNVPPTSAPPAATLLSDDEESADENADPCHRRARASSRQCSPESSPQKETPPEPPAKQRRTSHLQAVARAARSAASLASNPGGMAAGVGACATAGGAPSVFTSLLTALPAIVLVLLAIAIIGSTISTASPPRPRHVTIHRLHVSTGAEIETALCILESVLPTLVSTRYYTRKFVGPSLAKLAATQEGSSETRKLGIWNLGVPLLCLGPKRQEGASETRKLGIWNLGAVPWARTQEGASETRKLGIWNMPRSILESAHSESWNLEFAEEYPGICP